MAQNARAYMVAWGMALLFYVLEYATRSAPGVMMPQLEQAFGRTSVGVSNILGSYYYTYSLTSLVAGLALDRAGAKYVVPFGCLILGLGCLLFVVDNAQTAYVARLLQGAGSAFSFTGAVYLAVRGFSAGSLATAIGLTQSLGMLGGSAGQFVVGPLIQAGLGWTSVWLTIGIASLLVALALLTITPAAARSSSRIAPESLLAPYKIVLSNPQSYLSGLVAGLLFAPTTIGALTWGVAFLQIDRHFIYRDAALVASLVPLGWAFGCPIMGWLADRVGLRKPVLIGGELVMAIAIAQLTFFFEVLPAPLTLFVLGVASGVAMIPYTIIKEANPDNVKGSATGAINFINFGVTALIGPVFAALFGRTLDSGGDPVAHFQHAGSFWLAGIVLAIFLTVFLRETGTRRAAPLAPQPIEHLKESAP
jgi:MFS family permease